MTTPVRLRLSRKKGFDLQARSLATNGLPAVNVARPGWWGNPYKVGEDHTYYGGPGHERATATQCVALYRVREEALRSAVPARHAREMGKLRGKNLGCWCRLCARHEKSGKPLHIACANCAPCHVDVLGELANAPICEAA